VPPQQCPVCGRFLKKDFVAALTSDPTPCPRCETGLVAGMFGHRDGGGEPGHPVTETEPSVRPPDLRPEGVRDAPGEVLAGWDRGTAPIGVTDRAPFPVDAVVLAGAGLVGALLGTMFGERGCRGAVLGAAGGVFGAAVARTIWRLE
jgi:hypothetical protein